MSLIVLIMDLITLIYIIGEFFNTWFDKNSINLTGKTQKIIAEAIQLGQNTYTATYTPSTAKMSQKQKKKQATQVFEATNNAAKEAIKEAMIYVASLIVKNTLSNKFAFDEFKSILPSIIDSSCKKCIVKIDLEDLEHTFHTIIEFVSTNSIAIYTQVNDDRREEAKKARAEAEKKRAEESNKNLLKCVLMIQKLLMEPPLEQKWDKEGASCLGGLEEVLPSRQTRYTTTPVMLIPKGLKIRAILFVQMLLALLEALKLTITGVDDFKKFFKQLFVAWLKGKDIAGYQTFTIWMAKKHPKIDMLTLDPLDEYNNYLKKWDEEVLQKVVDLKNKSWSTNATPAYDCPAWVYYNHVTPEEALYVLSCPNVYNKSPLLSLDGNKIVWSEENFNSFDKFYFQYDKKPTSNSDDDD